MSDIRTTIRNIDPETLEQAREIVREGSDLTMGDFITDALDLYIETLPYEDEELAADVFK